ncbi:MAG TPA: hypothetical protein VGH74_14815 [Planctomycetaceae bacterium]
MNETKLQSETTDPVQPAIPLDDLSPSARAEQPQAWTMIENGRYQPRRIKGSCLGRELG